jgi:hypothetical protein
MKQRAGQGVIRVFTDPESCRVSAGMHRDPGSLRHSMDVEELALNAFSGRVGRVFGGGMPRWCVTIPWPAGTATAHHIALPLAGCLAMPHVVVRRTLDEHRSIAMTTLEDRA